MIKVIIMIINKYWQIEEKKYNLPLQKSLDNVMQLGFSDEIHDSCAKTGLVVDISYAYTYAFTYAHQRIHMSHYYIMQLKYTAVNHM